MYITAMSDAMCHGRPSSSPAGDKCGKEKLQASFPGLTRYLPSSPLSTLHQTHANMKTNSADNMRVCAGTEHRACALSYTPNQVLLLILRQGVPAA